MSDKRKREWLENLGKCYKFVQQSLSGRSAIEVAKELGIHRSTAHSLLNSLELAGKVHSEHGLWKANLEAGTLGKLDKYERLEAELDKAKEDMIASRFLEADMRIALALSGIDLTEKNHKKLRLLLEQRKSEISALEGICVRNKVPSLLEKRVRSSIVERLLPKIYEELVRYVETKKKEGVKP